MQSSPARSVKFLTIVALICAMSGCAVSKAATQTPTSDPPSQSATAAPTVASSTLPPNTISYVAEKTEPVSAIAHHYLSQSSAMLASDLETQIRNVNHLPEKQLYVKKGQTLLIPSIEPQPIVEHSVPMAKDEEVRAIYLTGAMAGSAKGIKIIQHWQEVGGNAVVFDIKDSDGSLSVSFDHPLAPHNRRAIPNLPKFVRYLHSMNLHAIARIALFRDEHIARGRDDHVGGSIEMALVGARLAAYAQSAEHFSFRRTLDDDMVAHIGQPDVALTVELD